MAANPNQLHFTDDAHANNPHAENPLTIKLCKQHGCSVHGRGRKR